MDEITSREKILKGIRKGLMTKLDNPYVSVSSEHTMMQPLEESVDLQFAQELSALGGKFIFCENEKELTSILSLLIKEENISPIFCKHKRIQKLLTEAQIDFLYKDEDLKNTKSGLTECEFLIARFGSAIMSSALSSGRKLYSWPEHHLIIAYASQLVPEISDAIIGMRERYNGALPSMITMITGASKTADIEKSLVMGAHGPKELYVFFIDDLM